MSSPPPTRQELLRALPRIDDLLDSPAGQALADAHSRDRAREALRDTVDRLRRDFLARDVHDETDRLKTSPEAVIEAAGSLLAEDLQPGMCRVVNGTGVVMHTGLGRSPLSPAAREALDQAARGYCLLEVDRASGERGTRETYVSRLLCRLTGAEAATVVNNNAAATLVILAALARGKEVICSRGQLVEIGGSYRIPEVMEESGATLVEVGATNKTHLRDYERAITDETAMLLRVHTSNYRVVGFTAEVPTSELATLGRPRGIPVVDDLGSGALIDYAPFGLPGEPTVAEVIAEGADVACFSGDKLLGGPQAGIIVGRADLVAKVRRHPLFRAIRPDKLALVALEATLKLYLNRETLREHLTSFRMLTAPAADVLPVAQALAQGLRDAVPALQIEVVEGSSQPGSGALPTTMIPTHVVQLRHPDLPVVELGRRLRVGEPCIFSRIASDWLVLDPRTMVPGDAEEVIGAVRAAAAPASSAEPGASA